MLRTLFSAVLIGAATLLAVPAFADDYGQYGNDRQVHSPDHAWYGDNDYSRCPSHRPLDVFRDGEGGFQAWRAPHRVCGWGRDERQYGAVVTQHG